MNTYWVPEGHLFKDPHHGADIFPDQAMVQVCPADKVVELLKALKFYEAEKNFPRINTTQAYEKGSSTRNYLLAYTERAWMALALWEEK